MKEPQTKTLFPGYTDPMISPYSYIPVLLYSLKGIILSLVSPWSLWQTLKMQNKAKLKIPKIPVTPYTRRTNKSALRPPQPKNKPKQTQTSLVIPAKAQPRAAIQAFENLFSRNESNVTPASSRQLKTSIVLIRDDPRHKKMTNKANFKRNEILVIPYILRTNNYELRTAEGKNKPNQSQFERSADSRILTEKAVLKDFLKFICEKNGTEL